MYACIYVWMCLCMHARMRRCANSQVHACVRMHACMHGRAWVDQTQRNIVSEPVSRWVGQHPIHLFCLQHATEQKQNARACLHTSICTWVRKTHAYERAPSRVLPLFVSSICKVCIRLSVSVGRSVCLSVYLYVCLFACPSVSSLLCLSSPTKNKRSRWRYCRVDVGGRGELNRRIENQP
jgi:hypothetical protein